LQLAIGTPLIALSGWSGPQVAVAYERAVALSESLGDLERLIPALFGLASNRVVRGETRAAQHLAERCRSVADRRGYAADRLLAHRTMGAVLMQLGALREARSEFEQIAALYDPDRDRSLAARYITDPHASGLSFLSLVLWIQGYPEQARCTAREAFRRAVDLGHANTSGHVLCHAGAELAQLLRDVPTTRDHAEAAIALAAEHDMLMWRGYGTVFRGWAIAEEGHANDGSSLICEGIGELDTLGSVFHRSHHLGILAELHGRGGDAAAGLGLLEDAQAEVGRTEVHFCQAELHRIEGELRSLTGAPDAVVEACFAEALALARRQEAKSFELRAATSLARRRCEQGRCQEARDLLAPVHGWFTEGFDTSDLRDARELLDKLC
jgi:predicted ATPase